MMGLAAPNSESPREESELHTRLLKCTLAVAESRAYWGRRQSSSAPSAAHAFEGYWFGAKSLSRVEALLANMRARFDAFPDSLFVLSRWRSMIPETRTAICHWHLQLADPLYRAFCGEFLVARRETLRAQIHRPAVISWVGEYGPARWNVATRTELASKLLSVALSAGLVSGRRDPRDLRFPRVTDEALAYLLYLLRGVEFEGTMTSNPYLRSVGLEGAVLEGRLSTLRSIHFRRIADVVDFGWRYSCLREWAAAVVLDDGSIG